MASLTNIVLSVTDGIKLPSGTTAERPGTPVEGMIRFNTTYSITEYYNGTAWINPQTGLDPAIGTSSTNPAESALQILHANPNATDGKYWIRPKFGSGTAFQTWCIMTRDGGGWMKAAQYNNGVDISGSAAINSGGTWIDAEINLAAGKIPTTDFNALLNNEFLLRVTGNSDPFLNSGAGTGKFVYEQSKLPGWGTDEDPANPYVWWLDRASDGNYEWGVRYTNDTRGRCNHTANTWINDHNYVPTIMAGIDIPSHSSRYICWTFGPTRLTTNLHWMSNTSTSSAGDIQHGSSSSTAAAIFIR